MGATIAYLYQTKGWRNFFILTKGSTIYQKTIANFTPGNPKYVLEGYHDLPNVALITGENYIRSEVATRLSGKQLAMGDYVNIFVFNIEKMFEGRENKFVFQQLREQLGGSMAELLAGLDDLVLLMDESHRYRATKSMAAITSLKPRLSLEFTATPVSKNIIYSYDLGTAISEAQRFLDGRSKVSGYIKIPVVLGRQDMQAEGEMFEDIQLQDGVARHRRKKAEIESYCINNDRPVFLPIVLISTKDIDHASKVKAKVEADSFFNGEYKGKVIVTHSNKGDLTEADIEGLLKLEDLDNNNEIVIHVAQLREGWDVKNVYTIIPLRASKSEILTEQTLGRGMRLPFGVQTGDEDLDTLEIAAHDHFAAIVSEASNNATRTGTPIITKNVTPAITAPKEVLHFNPIAGSPHYINVPLLEAVINATGGLQRFTIKPKYKFKDTAANLVAVVLGTNQERRIFNDIPVYEMNRDPLQYFLPLVFDRCSGVSASNPQDARLVPELVESYLSQVDTDPANLKRLVQLHSALMLSDMVEQLDAHITEDTTITLRPTPKNVQWRDWTSSVPQGYQPLRYDEAPSDVNKGEVFTGYQKTIYAEATFDSKQEKWLADILERDPVVRHWLRIPMGQLKISYGNDNYNPDLLADDGEMLYLLEVKAYNELDNETVQRKAAAALEWCKAASKATGRRWVYKLLSHADIPPTNGTFSGILSRAINERVLAG